MNISIKAGYEYNFKRKDLTVTDKDTDIYFYFQGEKYDANWSGTFISLSISLDINFIFKKK